MSVETRMRNIPARYSIGPDQRIFRSNRASITNSSDEIARDRRFRQTVLTPDRFRLSTQRDCIPGLIPTATIGQREYWINPRTWRANWTETRRTLPKRTHLWYKSVSVWNAACRSSPYTSTCSPHSIASPGTPRRRIPPNIFPANRETKP